jgi:hypothetical protein
MAEGDGGGVRIARMRVRVPGGAFDHGSRLAAHLQGTLGADTLVGAADQARVDVRVRVPADASPQIVAEAIARALRRRTK